MNVVGYIRVSTQGQARGYSFNGLIELLEQYQRFEIVPKLTKGRKNKAKEAGYAGGRVVYMKQKGEKELKINNVHAEVVKWLFELKQLHRKWSLS